MAFDSSTSPLLTTTSVSGDPSVGLQASENLVAQTQYGLQVLDGGAGGQFEIRSAGNLLSLAELSTAGLIAIAVPGVPTSLVSITLQSDGSVSIDDDDVPGGLLTISVVPSTTLQFHQTQVNGIDVGTPYNTINFVNSATASFIGTDGGTKANVTVNVEGEFAPTDGPFVITQADADLTGATNLGLLATGLVYSTEALGVSTLSTTTAPTMSGANITAGTIPIASVVGTAVNLTSVQTITGAKTFTSNVIVPTLSVVSGTINMNNHKIVNVTDPTDPQDAATKAYVDLRRIIFDVSTTDATPTAAATIAVASDTAVTLIGTLVGKNSGSDDMTGGRFMATALNTAGTLALVDTPEISLGRTSSGSFNVVVSGTDLIIQVTGIAQNYSWSGVYSLDVI